jgi:Ca2+-binding RTX toxin-like protein
VVRGGRGSDALFGEEGNDRLPTRDGTADTTIDGGAGTDRARIDAGLDTPTAVEILAP